MSRPTFPAQTYTCPNGHKIVAEDNETVECTRCDLIATWLDRSSGTVHTWMDYDDYSDACRDMQDQMDAAFDHQYFD